MKLQEDILTKMTEEVLLMQTAQKNKVVVTQTLHEEEIVMHMLEEEKEGEGTLLE